MDNTKYAHEPQEKLARASEGETGKEGATTSLPSPKDYSRRRVESRILKDQRDEYSKEERPIPKWTQYYCVNHICILQH